MDGIVFYYLYYLAATTHPFPVRHYHFVWTATIFNEYIIRMSVMHRNSKSLILNASLVTMNGGRTDGG